MKHITLFSIVTVLFILGCSPKLKNGTYSLDHIYKGTASNLIGEQDQELKIENDKIQLIIYEPYISPLKGTIHNNLIVFENGDTLSFEKTKAGLNTHTNGLVYVWIHKNK